MFRIVQRRAQKSYIAVQHWFLLYLSNHLVYRFKGAIKVGTDLNYCKFIKKELWKYMTKYVFVSCSFFYLSQNLKITTVRCFALLCMNKKFIINQRLFLRQRYQRPKFTLFSWYYPCKAWLWLFYIYTSEKLH